METYRTEEGSRHEDLLSKIHTLNVDSLKPGFKTEGRIEEKAKDTDVIENQKAPENSFDKWLDRFDEKTSFDNLFI